MFTTMLVVSLVDTNVGFFFPPPSSFSAEKRVYNHQRETSERLQDEETIIYIK